MRYRGTDLCPACGSGHTTYYDSVKFCFWRCNECGSKWCSRHEWAVEYQVYIHMVFEVTLTKDPQWRYPEPTRTLQEAP